MKRYIVFSVTFILLIVSLVMMFYVKVNYDMKRYLPKDENLVLGMDLHDEYFGTSSYTHLLIENESLHDVLVLKDSLLSINHVSHIDFIDSIYSEVSYGLLLSTLDQSTQDYINYELSVGMQQGLSFTESFYRLMASLPAELTESLRIETLRYQKDGIYKMTLMFDLASSDASISDVITSLKNTMDEENIDYILVGGVMSDIFVKDAIEGEVLKITLFLIPIVLVLLLLMSPSLSDLIVFIVISGVAIIINLGTNAFFPDISFITQSMAIALQLAISLDYMIFIVHRYHKDRINMDKDQAIKTSLKHVSSPVIASALTTAVSFLALVVMRFSIGVDIGLVFLKAVMISAVSSLILGPLLMTWLDKWMMKTKHKVFIPKFHAFSLIVYKLRYLLLAVFLLMIIPAYLMQSNNHFIYGESSLVGDEGTTYAKDINFMVDTFGYDEQLIIITEKDAQKEQALYQALTSRNDLDITRIQSIVYYQAIIQDPLMLNMISTNFYQGNYHRIIISLNIPEESEKTEEVILNIKDITNDIGFTEAYFIGSAVAALTLKDVIEDDYIYVTLIALVMIMMVIFITFKNLLLPILLPAVIMTSVFMSMSIPYLLGQSLSFLGYLIVSTVLLGATIDYAILFTKRYIELREVHQVHESIKLAIEDSAPSILTSALIFGSAGLSIGFISSVLAIKQIGLQIGIGAMFGMLSVLILLPQLLFIFDKWMMKSKINKR